MQMQAMDPSEVREALKQKEISPLREILDDVADEEWGLEDLGPLSGGPMSGKQLHPRHPPGRPDGSK